VAIFTTAGFTCFSIEERDGSLLPEPSDKGSAPYVSKEKLEIKSQTTKFLKNDIIAPKIQLTRIYAYSYN
jgi:hypothetical protein